MQTSNRLFDDFAKVASGAMNTLGGLREEVETRVRERLERVLADMDLVTREEFDAARAMAVKARAGQEDLALRLARVEAELAAVKARDGAAEAAPVDPAGAVGGTGPLVVEEPPEAMEGSAPEAAGIAPAAPAVPAEDDGMAGGEAGVTGEVGVADGRRDGGTAL